MMGSDFSKAQLDGFTAAGGDWSYTNLKHARLAKQDLRGICFKEADICRTRTWRRRTSGTATWTRVNLSQAKLKGADFAAPGWTGSIGRPST